MNQKAKKEIIVTVIMIIVLILIIPFYSLPQIKKKKGAASTKAKVKKESLSQVKLKPGKDDLKIEKQKESFFKLEEEAEALKLRRDPFTTGVLANQEEILPSDLSVYGIIWDEARPLAIINENIVKAGDKIGQNIIVKIERNCVIINDGTKDYKLNLDLD
ncbi:MAG: hypothetical protein NC936_04395 [Candidatus Omnitrophica bacterium]|nr:hypothetical protein [Candidatus Omnitrophota bacterium]